MFNKSALLVFSSTVVVFFATIMTAFGQTVYKCQQEDGTIKFQQQQCADGKGKVDVNAPKSDGSGGLRETERDMALKASPAYRGLYKATRKLEADESLRDAEYQSRTQPGNRRTIVNNKTSISPTGISRSIGTQHIYESPDGQTRFRNETRNTEHFK